MKYIGNLPAISVNALTAASLTVATDGLIVSNGRTKIGTTSDDGINELQVTGNTKVIGNIETTGSTNTRLPVSVISTNTTATAGTTYIATASLTLTLPASPTIGMQVGFINRSGTITCVIGRNSQNIMGLAENMTVDNINYSLVFIFTDTTRGWVIN